MPGAVPSARLCWIMAAVSGAALTVLAAVLIPWAWVPGGDIVPVRGSEVFTAAQLERGETYSGMQRLLSWASLAVSLVLGLVLGLTRLGAGLAGRVPGPWWVRALLTTLLLLVAGEVVTAPFAVALRANALEFGLTRQPIEGWLRDQGTSLLVAWALSGVVVLLVVGTARRSPRQWPLWAGLAGVVLTFAGSWGYPLVVEPLFNEFSSLPDGRLRADVLALASAEGVPVSDVLVADASRRTTTLNAYVSGIGSTKRVVLYDNLVEGVPRDEALVVVAHELAHSRNHDVLVGTLLTSVGVLLGSALLGLVLGRRRLLTRAGALDAGQPEVVALLLALVAVGSLIASPVENTMSRAVEARADRDSLAATGDHVAFERMQVQLATRSLSDHDPPRWSQFWFGSHPTTVQRIGLARALERQPE